MTTINLLFSEACELTAGEINNLLNKEIGDNSPGPSCSQSGVEQSADTELSQQMAAAHDLHEVNHSLCILCQVRKWRCNKIVPSIKIIMILEPFEFFHYNENQGEIRA